MNASVEQPSATAEAQDTSVRDNSAVEKAPSMDQTLKDAYRTAMAKEEGGSDEPALDAETPQDGRQRGPDGKFLPAKAKTNGAAPAQAAEPGTESAQVQPGTEPKPHDAAPNTWRKEIAAEFGKLPENVRAEIHRREEDFHKGITQYKEAAGFGTAMAQELLPYQEVMARNNVNARDVVKSLAASWNMLVTGSPQQKANLVLQLAKDYAIDLSSLNADPQQGQPQPTQEDPRLATALQRLEKLEGHLTLQERQRAEAEYSAHVNSVNAFGSDPKNKHFTAVREDMAALIESGRAKDLSDAYDKAIWINPEVRKLLLAEQDKARADKAATEAAAARKAAGANVTRRGTPPVPQKTGSIEDTLRARYRELTS